MQVFPNLTSRRIGPRGDSFPHYNSFTRIIKRSDMEYNKTLPQRRAIKRKRKKSQMLGKRLVFSFLFFIFESFYLDTFFFIFSLSCFLVHIEFSLSLSLFRIFFSFFRVENFQSSLFFLFFVPACFPYFSFFPFKVVHLAHPFFGCFRRDRRGC